MRALITGGAGFIGSNLAWRLAGDGWQVTVFDSLDRAGARLNLDWLQGAFPAAIRFVHDDVRDAGALAKCVPGHDAVFHLAGQVAVTSSVADPRTDFEVNALGTFNLLEAVRLSGERPAVIYASTNKVYGGMEDVTVVRQGDRYVYRDHPQGMSEERGLDFHSPYGCSKGAADQYVRDYGRIYGLRTVVFRMSCIYGLRQFGTEDQGWVAHFVIAASLGRPLTIYGDGYQIRDVLFVEDLIDAYLAAVQQIDRVQGEVFNVGGGPGNVLSLRELVALLERRLGRRLAVKYDDWRPGDQRVYVSDTGKLGRLLGWRPCTGVEAGLGRLLAWVGQHRDMFG